MSSESVSVFLPYLIYKDKVLPESELERFVVFVIVIPSYSTSSTLNTFCFYSIELSENNDV